MGEVVAHVVGRERHRRGWLWTVDRRPARGGAGPIDISKAARTLYVTGPSGSTPRPAPMLAAAQTSGARQNLGEIFCIPGHQPSTGSPVRCALDVRCRWGSRRQVVRAIWSRMTRSRSRITILDGQQTGATSRKSSAAILRCPVRDVRNLGDRL